MVSDRFFAMEDASAGRNLSLLLLDSRSWVHRRVETLTLHEAGSNRHSVSLDVTPPRNLLIEGSIGRVILPLGLLDKRMLRSFDLVDGSGKALSMLGSAENADLALQMMRAWAPTSLKADPSAWQEFITILQTLIGSDQVTVSANIRHFERWWGAWRNEHLDLEAKEVNDLEFFAAFAVALATHFLFLIEFDRAGAGTRTIIKYSFEVDAPEVRSGRRARFLSRVADYGFAASQHFEVRSPPGVELRKITFSEFDLAREQVQEYVDIGGASRGVSHAALTPRHRLHSALLEVEASLSKRGMYTFTHLAFAVVSMLVVVAWLVKVDLLPLVSETAVVPSASVSILLVGPALMFSWVARSPEHSLATAMFKPLRETLMCSALILLLMALAAAVPLLPWAWNGLWLLIGAVWVVAAARYCWYIFGPASPENIRRVQ